jgi:hypothetical protein
MVMLKILKTEPRLLSFAKWEKFETFLFHLFNEQSGF